MSDAWDAAEKGAAARQHLIRKGWPAAAVQALPDDAIGLDTKHEKGHRLLMPLRIGDEVVDVVALGDEGVPRRRGKGRKMPILGSIDDALFHGSTGEPVFIAVRPDDYLLAQCIVAQRSSVSDHGVALGVPAVGALEDLLKLLQQGMKKLGAAPGSIELWVVRPAVHWMSNLGLVHGKSWQLTISQLEDELVQALDWARVRQSTSELLPRDLLDPAGCWSVWDSAPYMLHAGSHEWRRTKRMPGVKLQGVQMLKAYAYRLPLSTAVRATYWKNNPKFGEQRLTMPGCTEFDLGDLVATWLSTHGVQTWCDKNGQEWAYWDKALMCISGEDRAEFIARLCQLAHLNPRTRAGQAVIAQVQINARSTRDGRKRPQREVRAWSWSGMVDGVPTTAMALGDAADRVVIAQPGKVTIEPNARTNVLKAPPKPIEWQAVTASEWSALMYDKMGRWLTCEPALRLLQVSWCLMALLGRRLKAYAPVRPILWPIGPAGSAKTHVAEMVEAFFYGGRASFGTPTPASLMSMAQWRPVFAIDNAETSMRTNEMVQLLLHAFMGTVRPKMKMNSDSKVIEQQIEAWFLLTSIEGGAVHELITRALFCQHDVIEFGDPEHDRHDPQAEIVEARDQMISGALTVWAERILPRLHAREGV